MSEGFIGAGRVREGLGTTFHHHVLMPAFGMGLGGEMVERFGKPMVLMVLVVGSK